MIGEPSDAVLGGQPVVVLEVNVDDATGETLAHTIGALLDAGAHDAWITPILMKKGRPAHTVSVLADVALSAQLAEVLVQETGSLGVRGATIDRWPAARQSDTVDVAGFPVRVKVSPGTGEGGARRRRPRRRTGRDAPPRGDLAGGGGRPALVAHRA